MIKIEPYSQADFQAIRSFIEGIQDHERLLVDVLKPGSEVGEPYAQSLLRTIGERHGSMLVARAETETIGFVSAYINEDDDMLVRDDAKSHGYISDLFVSEKWRRLGVATQLLAAIEIAMKERGCTQIRLCTKATNTAAVNCYEANAYSAYELTMIKALT